MNANAGDKEKYERTRDRIFSENEQALDAARNDNIPMMDKVFKTGGIKQEAIDYLMFSVSSVEMLKLFIRNGGDIHKLGPTAYPYPTSLLLWFSSDLDGQKYEKMIEFLIDEGADVKVADSEGLTAFLFCARSGNSKLCKLLVERGADPFVVSISDKMTALHAAAGSGFIEGCRYLLDDCGLDIDAMTNDLQTPLYLAAMGGRVEVCNYLMGKGASVDAGTQPLLAAATVLFQR
jgi:ankyrin repeat protein